MIKRIGALIRKEIHHIMRDWQTLMIILCMPVVMMFLYGYALTMDLNELPVLIEDPSPSPESRALIDALDATTLLRVIGTVPVAFNPEELFKSYKMKMLVRFPPDFARNLRKGGAGAQIQVLIDGSDPNVGTILKNAIEPLIVDATLTSLHLPKPDLVSVDQQVLYNPRQKSALYFVPGLMAIILLMISALLTSLTITREKETGTMEQLLVSPVRPFEIVIGKIVPYVFLAIADGILILLVGGLTFGITVAGSLTFLGLSSVVYIFVALAIGLLVSTVARTQQQAMLIVLPATMLPTIILSGFIFPLASLPPALRLLTHVVPATYFLEIIRGIMLKGVGIALLWKPLAALAGIGLLLIIVSVKKLRVRL